MDDYRARFYENYEDHKEWEFGKPEADGEYYVEEWARIGLSGKQKIIEIGFGSGGFLVWAKAAGHEVVGTEVNPGLVKEAKKRELNALESKDLSVFLIPTAINKTYDLIMAFDVLEHLFPDEISTIFQQAASLLKDGGKFYARFPNAQSPFSLQLQNADVTHVTSLTTTKLLQVATKYGFELEFVGNAARPKHFGRKPAWQRKILFLCRDLFEIIIGNLYFGGAVPLDPNLSVVLVKRKSAQ